jgi:RNA polymerase-binding transcription factor DksA
MDSEFARLLHIRNSIVKELSETAAMNIDPVQAEMNSMVLDWSPSGGVLVAERTERILDRFMRSQKEKLLQLRKEVTQSRARDNRGAFLELSEASPLGTHPADAGSDAYHCDFALNLLSHARDGLYEIDQALRRIESGTYGICEMSGQSIPRERLEAIPWARFTVECQSQIEKKSKALLLSRRVMPFASIENEEGEEPQEQGIVSESDENGRNGERAGQKECLLKRR